MTPGDRFKNWIDGLSLAWKERLKGWMASWLGFGIEVFFNVLGKAAAPKLKPLIDSMEATGKVPPELQPILDEMRSPTGEISGIFASSAGYALVGGAIGKILDAILLPLAYAASSVGRNVILTEPQLLASWLREDMTPEQTDEFMTWLGHDDVDIDWLKKLVTIRLDPDTITRIWLRDKEKYENLWHDLKHQGWTEDRIAVAKELANIIPPLADMVRFADFSAFDVDVIRKWIDYYPAPSEVAEAFKLIGITNKDPGDITEIRNWANKYWFSHYVQPGRYELGEMYRRGLLGEPLIGEDKEGEAEATIKLAYKTMAYSEFWQDRLLQLVKEIPTRVDVRRWWDMRTIDEAELRSIYQRQGYFGKDLDNYVLWTKVYVAFPDLITRWKNGWISEGEVRAELTALGMPAERLEEMIQTKIKAAQPERIEKERDLTKSEIVKGVKKEYITWDEGIDLLVDLGYDPTEADFILSIWVAVEAGSPETFAEFKELTQKWKKSVAIEPVPVQPELKAVADEVVRITKEIEEIKRAIAEEERTLVDEEILPEAATERITSLHVTLHRAEASLGEARSRYDKQLAIFRHTPPAAPSP